MERMSGDGADDEVPFPEHSFLLACLRLGLTIQDLKQLTYVDVMKIFLSIEKPKNGKKKEIGRPATQADIDRLLG